MSPVRTPSELFKFGSPAAGRRDGFTLGNLRWAVYPCVFVAAVCVSVPASAAPVKRLAWTKAAAVWTAQAKRLPAHAVSCSDWSMDRSTLSCTFYNPAVDARASTFIAGGRHRAYGQIEVTRYDRFLSSVGVEPHAGCTYLFRVFGPSLGGTSQPAVVDVCARGWQARIPRAM